MGRLNGARYAGNRLELFIDLSRSFTVWCRRHTGALRVVWSLLLCGLGWLLVARLATLADLKQAWSQSLGLGFPLLLLLALPAVSHFIKMLGWRSLLPPELRPRLATAYATFVAAQGVNELGFSVLGEPLKIWVLPPDARAIGLRAVLADNLAALAALFAVIASLSRLGAGASAPLLRAWLALPCAALVVLVLWRARRERWSGLLSAFAAHYCGKLWLVVELGLGLHFLGQPALAQAPTLALAWLGAAAIGAPVPGQLGVVEAALVKTGASLGLAVTSLLALALVRRLRSLVWVVVGLLLAARMVGKRTEGKRHVSTAVA